VTDTATHLYLVRHGATPSNERRPHVLQGRGVDQSLSAAGREQAEAVGRFFADRSFDALYSSELKRAFETAEAIGRAHDVRPTPVPGLHEVDVGRWEGLDWGVIERDDAETYAAFMADPTAQGYPAGETYADVLARVRPVFDGLLERHAGETIVVVAHNVVNRVYLADLLGLPVSLSQSLRQRNTGVNLVKRKGAETYVVTLNAAFHLSTID
jgi:broad specificity phosphatase PhoE